MIALTFVDYDNEWTVLEVETDRMKPLEGLVDEFVELDVDEMMENHGIGLDGVFDEWTQSWDRTNNLVGNCRGEAIDSVTLRRRLPEKESCQKPSIHRAPLSESMCNRRLSGSSGTIEPENQSSKSYLAKYPVDYPLNDCEASVGMAFRGVELLTLERVVDGAHCGTLPKQAEPLDDRWFLLQDMGTKRSSHTFTSVDVSDKLTISDAGIVCVAKHRN